MKRGILDNFSGQEIEWISFDELYCRFIRNNPSYRNMVMEKFDRIGFNIMLKTQETFDIDQLKTILPYKFNEYSYTNEYQLISLVKWLKEHTMIDIDLTSIEVQKKIRKKMLKKQARILKNSFLRKKSTK